MSQADNCLKSMKFAISNSKPYLNINVCTRFGKNPLTFTRYCPEMKIWAFLGQINLPITNPIPDHHNINAQTRFGENPLMFTQVIIWKRNMGGRTDRHTDAQHEALILRHYGVAGYDNKKKRWTAKCYLLQL